MQQNHAQLTEESPSLVWIFAQLLR